MRTVRSQAQGHCWTLACFVRDQVQHPKAPAWAQPFGLDVPDCRWGRVHLKGWLHDVPGSDSVVLLVHGLSGSADSPYCLRAASAAVAGGMSALRLHLRGADGRGEDFYHAGLIEDLQAVLQAPALAHYRRRFVLGFSLGGHVALRLAALGGGNGLRAVAAVCAPLDLSRAADDFDSVACSAYRAVILRGLHAMHAHVARRRCIPLHPLLHRVRTIRDWDQLVVAPRHGYPSAEAYYRGVSVAPHLAELSLPSLLVASEADPMVRAASLRQALARASGALEVQWLRRGGHLGFPAAMSLGEHAEPGLGPQLVAWLRRHG